jgi:hypothetical protein
MNMFASNRAVKRREASFVSRPASLEAGQNVPVTRSDVAHAFAGWMMLAIGALVLANTGVSSASPAVTGADWSFALTAAVISLVTARGLWDGARWAWWIAVPYGLAGLFFVLPVTASIAFGAAHEPVGTGWDVLLFPLITALMVALLVALWMGRPQRHGA